MDSKITQFLDSDKKTYHPLRKKDLKQVANLKQTFTLINQHLYGKLKYTHTDTRSRSKEIINLLFCKLLDEMDKSVDDILDFSIRPHELKDELHERVQDFFQNQVVSRYSDVFEKNEKITLDKELLYYIVKKLQNISLLTSSKDILSDAFEIFVSKVLKDEGGQFFTPPNIVKFMVNYLDPEINSKILDPACGHGGFLLEIKELWWNKTNQDLQKRDFISKLFGIDKDLFLAKICKLYLDILSGGKSNVFCEDSLDYMNYRPHVQEFIRNNWFDYILTNPPFGSKIPIDQKSVLKNYQLGHRWNNNDGNHWMMENTLLKKQSPQILFIERCVQLLKDGGKLGIVLPEGIFGNPSDRYIWEFLESNGIIIGIISLDPTTFLPYTCNKTSILFFQKFKKIPIDYKIDFAIVENVGHDKDGKILYKLNKDGSKILDSMGNPIINDELLDLHERLKQAEDFNHIQTQKQFKIHFSQIRNHIFIPNYYTGVEKTIQNLSTDKNFVLKTIGDLIEEKIIYTTKNGYLPRGDEIGSLVYGLGDIPFIRTSEIHNWEINLDPNKKTSKEVYEQYRQKQNIEQGDILLVKDGGPNLIGKTAYITELDTEIIIQSHIYQIKVLNNKKFIDSYLLLYLLNLDIVQKQIQAITFVQGTIATIGNRIMEVRLPLPSNIEKRKEISSFIQQIIEQKVQLKKKIKQITVDSIFKLK